MNHPLEKLPAGARKPLFRAFLAGTLVLFAVFRVLNAPLVTPAAPGGIVTFELAGSPASARAVLAHLAEFAQAGGTVVLVTHDVRATEYAQRTLQMTEGRLCET